MRGRLLAALYYESPYFYDQEVSFSPDGLEWEKPYPNDLYCKTFFICQRTNFLIAK